MIRNVTPINEDNYGNNSIIFKDNNFERIGHIFLFEKHKWQIPFDKI